MIREVLVSIVTSLVTGITLWAWTGLSRLPGEIRIPKGAVVAMNATKCPEADGWKAYERGTGSVIVGVGRLPKNGPELVLEQLGGNHQIVLQEKQLPAHKHDTLVAAEATYSQWGSGPIKTSVFGTQAAAHITSMTSPIGEGQAIDVMPPFVALRFCEKQ